MVDAVMVDAMMVDVVAGPDAGRSIALVPGRYLVGRAPGPCRIADPLMEPHHAILQIDHAGPCRVVQLTGRTTLRVDGHLVDGVATVVRTIELGSSRLSVRPALGCTLDTAVSTALRERSDDRANEASNWCDERCRPLCGIATPHPLRHVRTDAVLTSPPGRGTRSA